MSATDFYPNSCSVPSLRVFGKVVLPLCAPTALFASTAQTPTCCCVGFAVPWARWRVGQQAAPERSVKGWVPERSRPPPGTRAAEGLRRRGATSLLPGVGWRKEALSPPWVVAGAGARTTAVRVVAARQHPGGSSHVWRSSQHVLLAVPRG